MHQRRLLSTLALCATVSFLVAAGCGSDEEGGGSGGSSSGSGGKGGSAGSGGSASGGSSSGGSSSGGTSLGGSPGSPEPTGSTCQVADDCYDGLDTSELSGAVECIDKVEDGYCTHECETDEDCCALEGECRTGFRQVCAPFENTGVKYCFLSCEDEDLVAAAGAGGGGGVGSVDANEYCEREANPRFTCRSTGGGIENRLACLPEGGAAGAGGQGGAGGTDGAGGADAGGAAGGGGAPQGGGGQGGA